MKLDYIDEAFKKLDLLNEEAFTFSSHNMGELDNFLSQDDTSELVKVIDPDATTPEELSPSYVGKIITNCNVCHSNVFTDKNDIMINEDGIVNIEKQCPYCGELEGFTILGEIVPFDPNAAEENVEEPVVEVDGEEVSTDEQVSENVTEAFEGLTNREKLKKAFPELNFDAPAIETLEEAMNNVNVETDDTIVTVNSDENGKVTVSTEPKEAPADEAPVEASEEGDMIAPLSDDTIADIEAVATQEEEENTEEPVADTEAEEPSDEAAPSNEETPDEEVEVDLDEVDEEGLDELGESYFKRVYENVDSYKTSAIYMPGNKLIVEGLLTFTSGTSKKTGFVFEAIGADDNGKVLFEGYNPQLSRGKKAFSLLGTVSANKFLPESLKYNYIARGTDTTDKVSGKITRA